VKIISHDVLLDAAWVGPLPAKVFDTTDIRLVLPQGRRIFSDFFPIKNGNGLPFAHTIAGAAGTESEGADGPDLSGGRALPAGPLRQARWKYGDQ
jgi:hypothetical protein